MQNRYSNLQHLHFQTLCDPSGQRRKVSFDPFYAMHGQLGRARPNSPHIATRCTTVGFAVALDEREHGLRWLHANGTATYRLLRSVMRLDPRHHWPCASGTLTYRLRTDLNSSTRSHRTIRKQSSSVRSDPSCHHVQLYVLRRISYRCY
jgi:hypothetical protein